MTKNKDPLSKLIAQKGVNKEALTAILKDFVQINPDSCEIILLPNYSKLKNKEQILIILLGFKALYAYEAREKEMASPKEIGEINRSAGSTIRGILRTLEDDERMLVSKKGKYKVPNYLLPLIKDKFEKIDLGSRQLKLRRKKNKRSKQSKGTKKDFSRIKPLLRADIEKFDPYYTFLTSEKGKYLEKSLIILKIAEDLGIDGLTSAEITKVLKETIKAPRIHQSNISLYLNKRESSKYISTKSFNQGSGFLYILTKPGEDFVNNFEYKKDGQEI